MDVGEADFSAAEIENISRTYISEWPAGASPCGYIVGGIGGAARFCNSPAERGSSYCRLHRALCQVAPGSPEAAAIIAEFEREADRPPLPGVGCDPLLETPLATEAAEVIGELAPEQRPCDGEAA
jgi:hypothetical protein